MCEEKEWQNKEIIQKQGRKYMKATLNKVMSAKRKQGKLLTLGEVVKLLTKHERSSIFLTHIVHHKYVCMRNN
ncbi:hypothetical protein MNB_SV-5-1070 [hydrothermal vent metagenome]|uniref:Uncharacterized protein n=1 Tax=hydrothermal vent metagenome TaxID=652676 RepID=A0A1W1EFQ1_9ZZZZ